VASFFPGSPAIVTLNVTWAPARPYAVVPLFLAFNAAVQQDQRPFTFAVSLTGVGNGHIGALASTTNVTLTPSARPVVAFQTPARFEQVGAGGLCKECA